MEKKIYSNLDKFNKDLNLLVVSYYEKNKKEDLSKWCPLLLKNILKS